MDKLFIIYKTTLNESVPYTEYVGVGTVDGVNQFLSERAAELGVKVELDGKRYNLPKVASDNKIIYFVKEARIFQIGGAY